MYQRVIGLKGRCEVDEPAVSLQSGSVSPSVGIDRMIHRQGRLYTVSWDGRATFVIGMEGIVAEHDSVLSCVLAVYP